MNNEHTVTNQFKHGINYINQVKLRKTAVKPTWVLINLVIEAGVNLREESFFQTDQIVP